MRKTMLKMLNGVALAILLALTLSQVPVSGQDAEALGRQESSKHSAPARRLEGTWLVQVTIRNCETGDPIRSFPSLVTYAEGGTVMETTSGIPPALRYPGQGVWRHVGGRRYAATFMFFRFNSNGSYAGTQKITQDIELSSDGEELNITATIEVFDANGVLIPPSGCVTSTASRFE